MHAGLALQDFPAHLERRKPHVGPYARADQGNELWIYSFELPGLELTCKNDLAAAVLQVFDERFQVFLGFDLVVQELHIVKEQKIKTADLIRKNIECVRTDTAAEPRVKILGCKISNPGLITPLPEQTLGHGLRNVRLAEAGTRAQKKGINAAACAADVLGRGERHLVGWPHHEILEGKAADLLCQSLPGACHRPVQRSLGKKTRRDNARPDRIFCRRRGFFGLSDSNGDLFYRNRIP